VKRLLYTGAFLPQGLVSQPLYRLLFPPERLTGLHQKMVNQFFSYSNSSISYFADNFKKITKMFRESEHGEWLHR
jgi:hypothetical protein